LLSPLVPEVAVDFVDAVEPAHDQALQVQFGRDAQVQIHVQGVVVRAERPGVRAAQHRVHHGRFDFHVAAVVQELADVLDDLRAGSKDLPGLLVHDKVHVAHPVALLHVLQAVPLFGQRMLGLRQDAVFPGLDGQFAGPRAEQHAAHAHDVADVGQFQALEGRLVDGVLLDVCLQRPRLIADAHEGRLPERVDGHDAAGQGDLDGLGFQRRPVLVAGGGDGVRDESRHPEVVGVADPVDRLDAGLLLQSLTDQFVLDAFHAHFLPGKRRRI
jgi:hypothetical protein